MNKFLPFIRALPVFCLTIVCVAASADIAWATADASSVARNMTRSVTSLPGLLTAIAYGLGLMMGVSGIIKLKEHVETPNQTPLRTFVIRMLVGGGLFALPMVFEAARNTIGNAGVFQAEQSPEGVLTAWSALGGFVGTINNVFTNIMTSLQSLPGLFTAVAYLLGTLFCVSGLLKLREHVETPEQVQLKEPCIRLLTGGAMFALPILFTAAMQTIDGNGAFLPLVLSQIVPSNAINAGAGVGAVCNSALYSYGTLFAGGGAGDAGNVICNAVNNTSFTTSLVSGFAYLFGIVLIIWGVLKIKDNVLNPQQTSIWEGISRLVAGGCFFALPYLINVVANTLDGNFGLAIAFGYRNSGFSGQTTGAGLDSMMVRFTADIFGPMLFALNVFGYTAGTILLMIGISRLLKSAQEGPRGPGGIGTIFTFLTAGAMISLSPMIGAFGSSFFGAGAGITAETNSAIAYTTGMNATEVAHVQAVISAILQFMIVLGVVAFLRGIYIIREVAEGNQQASMMAGITHMAGGALAVNLGPVMNAIQVTLGLTAYGINFT